MVSSKLGTRVLSLAWDHGNTLYVGSEAGKVHRVTLGETEEDTEQVSVPGLHSPVHSLATRGNLLVIGSRNIVFWNMDTKSVYKTCTGHANPVSHLMFDVTGSVLFSSAVKLETLIRLTLALVRAKMRDRERRNIILSFY